MLHFCDTFCQETYNSFPLPTRSQYFRIFFHYQQNPIFSDFFPLPTRSQYFRMFFHYQQESNFFGFFSITNKNPISELWTSTGLSLGTCKASSPRWKSDARILGANQARNVPLISFLILDINEDITKTTVGHSPDGLRRSALKLARVLAHLR